MQKENLHWVTLFFLWICFSAAPLQAQIKGQPAKATEYRWYGNDWYGIKDTYYFYDSLGRVTLEAALAFSTTDSLSKIYYTYAPNKNEMSRYSRDSGSGWYMSYGHNETRTFNKLGEVDTFISSEYRLNKGWNNLRMEVNAYNADTSLAEQVIYSWNAGTWKKDERDTYTYDTGSSWSRIVAHWVGDSAWIFFEKHNVWKSGYDYIDEVQNWGDTVWVGNLRIISRYDSLGNYTGYRSQYGSGGSALAAHTIAYTYEGKKIRAQEESSYDFKEGWEKLRRVVYAYADDKVGINEVTHSTGSLHFYPNPTHDILYVDNVHSYKRANVADMNGHTVLSQVVNGNELSLDVSALRSGLYLLKLEGDKGTVVKKFIKR